MTNFTWLGDAVVAVAAYALGAWSWPWIHQQIIGAEAYAQKLRDRARAVLAAARGK